MFTHRKVGKGMLWRAVLLAMASMLLLVACTQEEPEPEIVTQVVEVEREVTRIVEGTPVVETVVEQVEVTRVVEVVVEPTEAPRGGSLVWGTGSEPQTLDPACTFSSIADIQYKTLYDSLVFWGPDQEFYPYLAESWEISDDFTSYTFNLRQDVTFHDGTPFNAEAVKINLDRVATIAETETCASANVAQARLGGAYDSSEVIDDFTVRVNFIDANPIFLIGAADLYFISPAALEEFGEEDIGRTAVGTGPFILEEWVEQASMTVVRNEDYNWAPANSGHQGPAYLEQITWQFIPDAATRLASLEAGEVHLVNRVETDQYAQLVNNPDLVTQASPGPGTPNGWVINATLPPTDDILVRQAIGHAIDRQLAMDTLFAGFYQVGNGPISAATWSYWDGVNDYNQYDPDLALELLEEAGWMDTDGDGVLDKEGQPLQLTLMELSSIPDRAVAWEFFQAQLAEIGIQLDLEFAEAGVVVDECHNARRNICGLRWRLADPSALSAMWASENIGTGFNWSHLADEEIDSLLATGASEADRAAREQIYQDLQKRIMDLAIWLPIWDVQIVHGAQPNLKDWFTLPNPEYIWLYDAYIEG